MTTETVQVQDRAAGEPLPEAAAPGGAPLGEGLQRVAESTRQLLKSTAEVAGDSVAAARTQLKARLGGAGEKLEATQARVAEKVRQSVDVAKGYVEAHPWKAAGVSALAGLLAGVVLSRKMGGRRPADTPD